MKKDRCPNCGHKEVVPTDDTEYMPMSLINPTGITHSAPKEVYCRRCLSKWMFDGNNYTEVKR